MANRIKLVSCMVFNIIQVLFSVVFLSIYFMIYLFVRSPFLLVSDQAVKNMAKHFQIKRGKKK